MVPLRLISMECSHHRECSTRPFKKWIGCHRMCTFVCVYMKSKLTNDALHCVLLTSPGCFDIFPLSICDYFRWSEMYRVRTVKSSSFKFLFHKETSLHGFILGIQSNNFNVHRRYGNCCDGYMYNNIAKDCTGRLLHVYLECIIANRLFPAKTYCVGITTY